MMQHKFALDTLISVVRALVILASTLVLLACASSGGVAPVEERQQPPSQALRLHIVDRNETLYSIAFRYEKDYRQLARINGIREPYTLTFQQKIYLLEEAVPASVRQQIANREAVVARTSNNQGTAVTRPAPSSAPRQPVNQAPSVAVTSSASAATVVQTASSATSVSRSATNQAIAAAQLPAQVSDWAWPLMGRVTTAFGGSKPISKGISIATSQGTPVKATADAVVVYAGSGLRGYGNLIILKHNDLYLSAYGHNRELRVSEGDSVKQGQVIALSGKSLEAKEILYFEIRKDGRPVDPIGYLPRR